MKILVPFGFALEEEAVAAMRQAAEVVAPRDGSQEALLSEARDATTILAASNSRIDRAVIESAPLLRHIARGGVGVDGIDLAAATEHGIFVTNTPELTVDSVSELTVALLLGLARNIPRCDRAIKEDNWYEKGKLARTSFELNGKTHGIVGMGKIGSRVAVVCRALGMKVLYFKRTRDRDLERFLGVEYAPFERLIRECDSISLHCPLTEETRNLFDKPQFESMKKTALLINQSRGDVVNEGALLKALKENRIAGYATDVYRREPPDPRDELFKLPNVVATPHVGGQTREARLRSQMAVAETMVEVMGGGIPKNLVNREALLKGKG